MPAYIARRVLQAAAICLVISAMSFFMLFLNTDPALMLLPPEANVSDIAVFKAQMGLDRPVIVQYGDFLGRVVFHGDFGQSFVYKVPALQLIRERFPATLKLALAAVILINLISVPAGILSAVKRNSLVDNVSTVLVLMGQAMPLYWFGIMLIIVFGVWLRWLPISGNEGFAHLILPAVTLGSWILPVNMRLVRSGMLDVLNKDYIRTARAKGLPEWLVLGKHALKNAIIPLVTVIGMQLGALLGGAVVTETVFAWPGMGQLVLDSIHVGDYPVVQAVIVMFACFIVACNLAADIVAALIDPRIRLD
jgi:peptide/nickel transport system permease protein